MEIEKKARLGRTTRRQYEELVSFLETHRLVIRGKNKPEDAKKIETLWQNFARDINSRNCGPFKSAQQWKRILTEWKVNTKRKSREIFASQNGTGGGPSAKKSLTDLEERLLGIFSEIHLGDPELPDDISINVNESDIVTDVEPPGHSEISGRPLNSPQENRNDPLCMMDMTENTFDKRDIAVVQDCKLKNAETVKDNTDFNGCGTSTPVIKTPKQIDNRYTTVALQHAISKFEEVQDATLEATKAQTSATNELCKAVNNVSNALDKFNNLFEELVKAKVSKAKAEEKLINMKMYLLNEG